MGKLLVRKLRLRPVESTDCDLIWKWANDPVTRQVSLSPTLVTLQQHQAWFIDKLKDTQTCFYIVFEKNVPIGQIRFEIDQETAIVSVNLAPECRGMGYGARVIKLGVEALFEETSVMLVHAYIKPENIASIKAFMKAEFQRCNQLILQNQSVINFELQRRE